MEMKQIVKAVRGAIRARTRDVAFPFRMGAGFAGDVNRTHPAEIEAALINTTTPPTLYGQVVVVNATGNNVRPLAAADQSNATDLTPFGMTVRPYPVQQQTGGMSASIGAATPPVSGVIDILRAGLIMAQLNANVAAPVKGGRVYVWCSATSGDHIQGGLETEYDAGDTVRLDARYTYNGPPDTTGVVEVSCNV